MRRFVAACVQDHPAVDDIVLAADELASNAVQYSLASRPGPTGGFAVALDVTPGVGVHLSVDDPGLAPGTTTHSRPDDEHGRGRGIVARLTLANGDETTAEGHRAWADFGWPTPTPTPQAPAGSPRRNK